MDEVDFYEDAFSRAEGAEMLPCEGSHAWSQLLAYMLEYAGVLTVPRDVGDSAGADKATEQVEMLVLRNIRDGSPQFRLMDLKIGQKTSAANWKGKSRFRAARQDVIDNSTNSLHEGVRLEGVDQPALALQSRQELLSGAKKLLLQRMRCADMFMHFLDLHDRFPAVDADALEQSHGPAEIAEAVLREVARSLAQLAIACREAPAPQKWIGSSIALGFDAGCLPKRAPAPPGAAKRELHRYVGTRVTIFDWGRSELNTEARNEALSQSQQQDYEWYWRNYIDGVDRLAWEAARAYRHRFGTKSRWKEVLVSVLDAGPDGASDLIGQLKISPLYPIGETIAVLRNRAVLTYSIDYVPYPRGCTIDGVWRVRVIRASNLRRVRGRGAPNPVVEFVAVSEQPEGSTSRKRGADSLSFKQVTSAQSATWSPEWQEILELPIVTDPSLLDDMLASVSPKLVEGGLDDVLPRQAGLVQTATLFRMGRLPAFIDVGEACDEDAAFEEWSRRLDDSAQQPRPRSPRPQSPRPNETFSLSLGTVRRGSLAVRLIAGCGLLLSFCTAITVMACIAHGVVFSRPRLLITSTDIILGALAFFQMLFTPVLAMFDVPVEFLAWAGVECCQDKAIRCCGLHSLRLRCYVFWILGVVWICSVKISSLQRHSPPLLRIVSGASLILAGVPMMATHCGWCREYEMQKVIRSRSKTRTRSNTTTTVSTERARNAANSEWSGGRTVRWASSEAGSASPKVTLPEPPNTTEMSPLPLQ
eukprot:TRINITY_DN4121_c0_g6_i1.p1 TRINITY_DN4121_c0_g6~~TRINITY_DN4121_c0_g6_i1.p1  ORF type:complete len:885 (-),score=152.13 TRINITY_DN4121_c0_g6_i1:46-2319(-)